MEGCILICRCAHLGVPTPLRRNIFQGDSFSPFWVCIALKPLSWVLNNITGHGFGTKYSLYEFVHLMYLTTSSFMVVLMKSALVKNRMPDIVLVRSTSNFWRKPTSIRVGDLLDVLLSELRQHVKLMLKSYFWATNSICIRNTAMNGNQSGKRAAVDTN